jgi:hypothetical protein
MDRITDGEMNTLPVRGLEELRVNLLFKENSYVSNIILHRSIILGLKFYKLYVLICIMFSSLVKKVFISSSLGDKTVAGSDRSCISSASFGIQTI